MLAVKNEVMNGRLLPAKDCKCVDCGKQAQCYDHRDYRKPLMVEPVCKSCDGKRGAGAPYDGMDERWDHRRIETAKRMRANQILNGTSRRKK